MREYARLPGAPDQDEVVSEELDDTAFVLERTLRVHGLDGNPAKYFSALLNAPPLAATIVRFGTLIREGQVRGSYSDADRELVDVVYGEDLGYRGHYGVHLPDALAVGVRPEAIDALRRRRVDGLTEHERVVVEHARRVAAGTVDDDWWTTAVGTWGARGAIEFTIFCAFLVMTLRLWQALGVPDLTAEETDDLLRGLRDGTIPIPAADARIG